MSDSAAKKTPGLTSSESREFFSYEPHSKPDGMHVMMSGEVEIIEQTRRTLMDFFFTHGYEWIDPPVVDSLESLLTTASSDLQQKTLRTTDPENARPLGVRTDITPQVARLDARQMDHSRPQRYAYCGNVIHGQRDHIGARRNPFQIGIELFGTDSLGADLEVIGMAIDTCRLMGFTDFTLDLGHLGVFEEIFRFAKFHDSLREPLLNLIHRKSQSDVDQFLHTYQASDNIRAFFAESVDMHGGGEVLDRARERLQAFPPSANQQLERLQQIYDRIDRMGVVTNLSIDLFGSNNCGYERGLVFFFYAPRVKGELLRGGRYNDIGNTFGRPRSAIGFSGFLHLLAGRLPAAARTRVYVPFKLTNNKELSTEIERLRGENCVVIRGLSESDDGNFLACDQRLTRERGKWCLLPVDQNR